MQDPELVVGEPLLDVVNRSTSFIRARQGFDAYNARVVKTEVNIFLEGEEGRRIQEEIDRRALQLLGADINTLIAQRVRDRQNARPSWQSATWSGMDTLIASMEVRGELAHKLQEQGTGDHPDRLAGALSEFMVERESFAAKSLFF